MRCVFTIENNGRRRMPDNPTPTAAITPNSAASTSTDTLIVPSEAENDREDEKRQRHRQKGERSDPDGQKLAENELPGADEHDLRRGEGADIPVAVDGVARQRR
jgi:hypothetical protein